MWGNRNVRQQLLTSGIAYVVLGFGVFIYTIGQSFNAQKVGEALYTADEMLTHALVFTTILLLSCGTCALLGALLVKWLARADP
jgi:hypothetical protein